MYLPEKFMERLKQILPESEYNRTIQSFLEPQRTYFRVNTLKCSIDNALKHLRGLNIPFSEYGQFPNVFFVEASEREILTHSDLHENASIYIQNLSSMLPPFILQPEEGEEILDLAAAPGSKTLQMASLMNNKGWISAVEIVKGRFYKLKNNVIKNGADCVHTYLMDGAKVWKKCPERFDKVLLDAPCSSEARFRANEPDSFSHWSENKVKEANAKQRKLLISAVKSLKPEGTLVYSTCSFSPEENEVQVQKILDKCEGTLKIVPFELPFSNWQEGLSGWGKKTFDPSIKYARRILPYDGFEGFFICKFKKLKSNV